MYWSVRLGSIENRMELGAAKGHRWAGQIHLHLLKKFHPVLNASQSNEPVHKLFDGTL